MSSATAEVIGAGARQYVREPVNLVLLLVLPPLFIVAMSSAISTFSGVLGGNLGERAGAGLSGVWAASILTGVASFFLASASARVDGRLVLAGLRPISLTAAHVSATGAIALVTTGVSVGILLATQTVGRPEILIAAILTSALIYGFIGSLLSVYVRGDLEGSFVIILLFMLDAFVGGPLAAGEGVIAEALPLHAPSELSIAGMVDAPVKDGWVIRSGIYLLVTALAAALALSRRRGVQ